MRYTLNHFQTMQLSTIINKLNPWIGLVGSLFVIIPSLYDILDDPYKITKKHFILAFGIAFMILFLKEIFDRIINLSEEID